MPWRIATGLSLIVWVVALFVSAERLVYLSSYKGMLIERYGWTLSWHLVTAVAAVFAGIYWLARRAGLGDLGGKLKLMDKRLVSAEAHDDELGRRLVKEREGELS